MSQSARNDPEGHRRKELEHVPAKFPGHTPQPPPPAATEAPTASMISNEFLLGLEHSQYLNWDGDEDQRKHWHKGLTEQIEAHTAAAWSKQTAKYDELFKTNGDLARMLDCEKQTESERDALRACVVRLKEALQDTQEIIDIVRDFEVGEAEGPCAANRAHAIGLIVESAIGSVPADLAECCVVKRSEWEGSGFPEMIRELEMLRGEVANLRSTTSGLFLDTNEP